MDEAGDITARWAATAGLLAVAATWWWMATPLPPGAGDTDLVAHVAILVAVTLPPGAAVAAAGAYFATRNRLFAAASWVATAIFAAWLAGTTGALAFWSGELGCGPGGDPCETVVFHRAVVCLVALLEIAGCALFERRLRTRWERASGPS